ncbi:LysR family transcriptional regulator [Brachybacterium sp. FME24]|uniref:LysR family transcriptional regulator n=1 Tax=Brachybacterium sp. FME24 TaxID=2742605 RepID=UPI00186679E5|nr:LysR family transcriptional regulator [Brachybacterium sp. FME24]
MRDLKQLQYFRSTALAGSVRGAGARLGTAPSSISQQIRALEHDLGLELFTRVGRRLELTPVGKELLVEAEKVFEALGSLEDRATDLRAERSERLVIGYFSSAGAHWIADLVAYLEFVHPSLSVRLELTAGGVVETGQDLQLVVSGERELVVPASLGSELLLGDPFLAAVPRAHPLAARGSVTLEDLTALPWIDNDDFSTSDGRCRQIFLDACRVSGLDMTFRHQAHDYRTALEMVDRGLGATILPRLGLVGVGEATAVLPIVEPRIERWVHVVWRRETPIAGAVADGRRALRDLVAEESGPGSLQGVPALV